MKEKKANGWGIALSALGAIQMIGGKTFLRPCVHEDGSAAICAPAGNWLLALGAAVLLMGLGLIWNRSRAGQVLLSAGALGAGLGTLLVPGKLVPLCMMASMRCHLITKPGAQVLGTLIAVCGLISLALSARKGKKA